MLFTHSVLETSPHPPLFIKHSFISEQIGSFSKPSLQLHIKLPNVFKHFALVTFPSPQFPLFIMHSSMSVNYGILSKSTRVHNPPDQNPPAFKIHPIKIYIFVIY